MQSSAVVTLRALVMLLCLVLVPLAAIFGSALPQAFESLVEGRGIPRITRTANQADDARSRGGEAPAFGGAGQRQAAGEPIPPRGILDGTGSLWAPGVASSTSPGRDSPADATTAPPRSPAPELPVGPSSAIGIGTGTSPAPTAQAIAMQAGGESFQQIERRLRELGATYYLLETWGNTGQQYRFHCKVSVAGNPNRTRHFDATDNDPVRAMRRVVEEIEQYRSGAVP
jgi:hypothetical protein